MQNSVGIRREDKNKWEKRVPITPGDLDELRLKHDVQFVVQPSAIRAFSDTEYEAAGATVQEDLSACPAVFSVKEIPIELLAPGRTYVFFAHVIKGQSHNMPLLRRLMELGCNLIDYEKIVDEKGRRLIFFGRYAGIAGAVETLCGLGRRLDWEGLKTPFSGLRQPHQYKDLNEINQALESIGGRIAADGLPEEVAPLVVGIAGYGNVGCGAQEVIDILPCEEIKAADLAELAQGGQPRRDVLYKAVFKEEDTVEPISPGAQFDLQDYFAHPEKYRGRFSSYLPCLTVFMNAIYWEERYPRLITREALQELFDKPGKPKLRVIGDISCDVRGAVEATVDATTPESPTYVYDPADGSTKEGFEGDGVVMMTIDNLPCEIPASSSEEFSKALTGFVAPIASADFSVEFDKLALPPEIKEALILQGGELTPDFAYLEKFVNQE